MTTKKILKRFNESICVKCPKCGGSLVKAHDHITVKAKTRIPVRYCEKCGERWVL